MSSLNLAAVAPTRLAVWCPFRSRPQPASRSDHQPSVVLVRHRNANATRAADDASRRQFSRRGQADRPRARSRRQVPARPHRKCGAVGEVANMARDPLASLSSLPQRSPDSSTAKACAHIMQLRRAKSRPRRPHHATQLPILAHLIHQDSSIGSHAPTVSCR